MNNPGPFALLLPVLMLLSVAPAASGMPWIAVGIATLTVVAVKVLAVVALVRQQ